MDIYCSALPQPLTWPLFSSNSFLTWSRLLKEAVRVWEVVPAGTPAQWIGQKLKREVREVFWGLKKDKDAKWAIYPT